MNLASIAILILIIVLLILAVRHVRNNGACGHKGGSACGGDCANCRFRSLEQRGPADRDAADDDRTDRKS